MNLTISFKMLMTCTQSLRIAFLLCTMLGCSLTRQEPKNTLIGTPIGLDISLEDCNLLNPTDRPIPIYKEADASSSTAAQLQVNTYAVVTRRSDNGWFFIEGHGWAEPIRLQGDCIDLAVAGDPYDPPPFLMYAWRNPCRFVTEQSDVQLDGTPPQILKPGQRYVVTEQDETRYYLQTSDATGGWVDQSLGELQGDCSTLE